MNPGKPVKSFGDYIVTGINPVLVMVLVHSVCFYLAEIFYRGGAAGSTRWVLFWFVLAVVLIARIGIEQGNIYALAYGSVLALATWIYLTTIQPNPLFGAILLAIVWFTAHRITRNCTLVDDADDASGEGLMEPVRQLPAQLKSRIAPDPKAVAPGQSATSGGGLEIRLGRKKSAASSDPKTDKKRRKPATPEIPGIWLIYYSLAALPIFGLGQMLLPAGDAAARRQGFIYLFCYLAAALGLLVTTSFLGLRRYLRQRYLTMPGRMAAAWVRLGVVAAALVLGLSLLLPRPGAGEAWGALRYHIDYQLRKASQYAARFNPHGKGSGRSGNEPSPNNPPGNGQTQSGPDASTDHPSSDKTPGDHGPKAGPGEPGQGNPEGGSGGKTPGEPLPALTPAAGALYSWIRVLFWIAALAAAAWLIYRYRAVLALLIRNIRSAIRDLIRALLDLWHPAAQASPGAVERPRTAPFTTFKNPFLTGGAEIWPPEQLIAYSYEALKSWARAEESVPELPQTPREFCRELEAEFPAAEDALRHLAFLYGHVAYGGSVPASYNADSLRWIWDLMSQPRAKATPAIGH